MSATIKYKGETIATASNNTKTLLTAGKYMEANVVVTDTGGGGGATLQTKSVSYTPTESAISASVTPDTGYDGLDRVNVSVGAIDPNYVGSEVPRKSYTDMTMIVDQGGANVTAPAGYYASNATKTIQYASNPYLSYAWVNNNGSIGVDLEIDNGGYIDGDSYPLSFANAVPVQAAQTIYPSTSDQSIASGKYLTGAQTIKGVTTTNLLASNIKKDVVVEVGDSADPDRIVSVTGTYEGGGGGLDVNAVAMRTAPSGALVLDTATEVSAYVFYRGQMTSVKSSSVTSLKAYCFAVSNLTSASFYNVTTLEDHVFNYAKAMTATFPKVTNIGTYTFQYCNSGAYVIDIGSTLSSFTNTAFYGTDNMTSCVLILRRTAGVVTAPGLDGIPKPLWNANKTGTLYVPQALLASYQAASNWSTAYGTANTTFLAIEGSPYENYYADGTPIS